MPQRIFCFWVVLTPIYRRQDVSYTVRLLIFRTVTVCWYNPESFWGSVCCSCLSLPTVLSDSQLSAPCRLHLCKNISYTSISPLDYIILKSYWFISVITVRFSMNLSFSVIFYLAFIVLTLRYGNYGNYGSYGNYGNYDSYGSMVIIK